MRKFFSCIAVVTLTTPSIFAATGQLPPPMMPAPDTNVAVQNQNSNNADQNANTTTDATPTIVTPTVDTTSAPTETPPSVDLNAAPNSNRTSWQSKSMSLGEAPVVACTSNPAFAANSCDQCFEAPAVKVGQRLTGLFDNWINNTTSILIAYEHEQEPPKMITFWSNTRWSTNPADEKKIWKYGSDIAWIPSSAGSDKKQFMLTAGQKVRSVESDLAAGYTLEKTDAKNGELIGMIRYPLTFRVLDSNGNQGEPKTHNECVAYKLSAPKTPVTPPKTPTTPTPAEVTKPQTGPAETLLLIVAAFFIAFGLMFSLRKRV